MGYTDAFGSQHTKTLDAQYNLAVLLESPAFYEVHQALALWKEIVAGYSVVHGVAHDETCRAQRRLGICVGACEIIAPGSTKSEIPNELEDTTIDKPSPKSESGRLQLSPEHVRMLANVTAMGFNKEAARSALQYTVHLRAYCIKH